MIPFKDYIGQHFVGKRIHFKCDCILQYDVSGYCTEYRIINNEIILYIRTNKKTINIGLNTPNLQIEIIEQIN